MVRDMPAVTLLDQEAVAEVVREWAVQSGERVRDRRKALGFTQVELGTMAATTPETICRIELGQLQPREPLKLAIAYALMLEVEEIWPAVRRQALRDRAAEPADIMEATA